MGEQPSAKIIELLEGSQRGDALAVAELFPLLARELRQIARRHMAGQRGGHTLQTTALVHEAYLRLAKAEGQRVVDRGHFMALCSQVMRRILVDHARRRKAEKRGGGVDLESMEEAWLAVVEPDTDVVALDEALAALEAFDARRARVVELRFFGGLSVAETATALGISEESVFRDWRLARAWLAQRLAGGEGR